MPKGARCIDPLGAGDEFATCCFDCAARGLVTAGAAFTGRLGSIICPGKAEK